ncbi:MAG: hypothetical protein ACTSUU_07055, partial [Candidatus Thorarchaeota archaeon]
MRQVAVPIIVLISAGLALAGEATESPFSLGAGARDLGLGGATVACPDAVTMPYWNPSALTQIEHTTLGIFYSQLFEEGTGYQYIGATYPTLDLGTFGIALFRLGVSGIDRRDEANLDLGDFSDTRLAFYLAYAHRLSDLDLGFSLSLQHHSLDTYTSTSSPGLDISLGRTFRPQYTWLRSVRFGLNWRNAIRPSLKLVSEKVAQPQTIDLGIAISLTPGLKWDQSVTGFMSMTRTEGTESRINSGLEWSFGNLLALRGGLRDGHLALGLGIRVKGIRFDYAYLERDLGGLHTFSVTTEIGMPRSRRLE